MGNIKNNIRSFRYSDRVSDLLDQAEGNSLNEKFENLVRFCFDAVPKRQADLEKLEEQIQLKRKAYYDLCKRLEDVQQLISTLNTLKSYGEIAARKAESIAKDLD